MRPPNDVGRGSSNKQFDWHKSQQQHCCCDACTLGPGQVNANADTAAYRRHDSDIDKSSPLSSVSSSLSSTCFAEHNNATKFHNKPPLNNAKISRKRSSQITKFKGTSNGSNCYRYGSTAAPDDKTNLDAGYAWFILAIMFLLQSSISGSSRVYGLIYAKEVDIGYFDREEASWPISTASMVENLASILAPAMVQFFSWRQIELTAGFLFVISNLCAYFSNSLALDILCLGGVQGIALSLSTVLSLVINNDYFERYRTTAYGISMAGSTFGVLYLSPLVSWILDTCDDFRLAYLGFAGVFCMNIVLALFIKPRAHSSKSFHSSSRPSSSTASSHYGRGAAGSCGDVSVIVDDSMGGDRGKLKRLRTSGELSRYDYDGKQTKAECKRDANGMQRSPVALSDRSRDRGRDRHRDRDRDRDREGKQVYTTGANWNNLDASELWSGNKGDALLDSGQRGSVVVEWADIADSDSGSDADSVSSGCICGSSYLPGSGGALAVGRDKGVGANCESRPSTASAVAAAAANTKQQPEQEQRFNWFGSIRINSNSNGSGSNNNVETIANETSSSAAAPAAPAAPARRCSTALRRPLKKDLSIASVSDWAQQRRASILSNMSQEKLYTINGRRWRRNQSSSSRRGTTAAAVEHDRGQEWQQEQEQEKRQRPFDGQTVRSALSFPVWMLGGRHEKAAAGAAGRQSGRRRAPKHNTILGRNVSAEMYSARSSSGRKSILPNQNQNPNPKPNPTPGPNPNPNPNQAPSTMHRSSTTIGVSVAAAAAAAVASGWKHGQNTQHDCPTTRAADRPRDETSSLRRCDSPDASGEAADCALRENDDHGRAERTISRPSIGAFCWAFAGGRETPAGKGDASDDPSVCVVPLSSNECPAQGQVSCRNGADADADSEAGAGAGATKPATMKFISDTDRSQTCCCRSRVKAVCGCENGESEQYKQSKQTTDCVNENKMSADAKEHCYCTIGSKTGVASIVDQHRCGVQKFTGGANLKFCPAASVMRTHPNSFRCIQEDLYFDDCEADKGVIYDINDDHYNDDYDHDDDNSRHRVASGNINFNSNAHSPQHDEHEEFNLTIICNLLKSPYLHLTWMMLSLYYIVARVFVIILVDFAKDHSLSAESSMGLLNYWSLGELCGRLVLGSLIDLKWTSVRNCISITCFLLASALCAMALIESYIVYALCSAFVAALTSLEYMLINVLLVEYMGKQCVTGCYALASLISSVILFIRPIMIGFFRDRLGSYDGLLLLLSALSLVIALLFAVAEPICARYWSAPPATKSKSSIRSSVTTSRHDQSISS